LLLAVPEREVERLLGSLTQKKVSGAVVGQLTEGEAGSILVV
jgi:hypothetical protein